MFAVEIYAAVRRFVFIEGKSRREAARVFGLSRDTIAKMCRYSAPPGYVRSKAPERPKLGLLVPVIDAILESDKTAPPKQRHTAKRIFERLRLEHGFAGGYTVVKDYVRIARSRSREVFVPLAHPPGHAQVDFGECFGVIGGVRMKLHVFCFDLPHSDACFIKAYPAETTEAFLDGHISAFAFFGGVPLSILYDNLKVAVARILGDGKRQRRHPRVYGRGQFVFDPKHYLALLEQKPGALDQAAPLQNWTLPEPLQHLRRLLEARMGNRGKREFIQALRLIEVFPETLVAAAALDAIRLGAISFDAIKQLVIAKVEHRPANLDLGHYPYLPAANVKTTSAADYMVLVSGRAA